MKQLFLILLLAGSLKGYSQTYGGQIQGKTNAGTIGTIGRNSDQFKVWDSTGNALLTAMNAKIPSNLTVTSTRLLVDGSGVTQPVSGTVTINAIPAGTNNIGDVDVLTVPADPFGVNADAASSTGSISAKLRFIAATGIPITSIAGTVSLPTGASTLAEQQTQTTALQLIDNLPNTLGSATSGQSGALALGAVTTAAPSYTTAQSNALSLQTDGSLRVANTAALPTGSNVIGAVTQSGTWNVGSITTLPALVAGTALIGKVGIDQTTVGTTNAISLAQLGANTIATGNGASSTGVLRVSQVNDGTGVLATVTTVSTVTNLSQMGGQAIALNTGVRSAGTQRVTIATDDIVPASQSGTWTVQPGNTANTTPWLFSQNPTTSGGLTTYHLVSAGSTNATNVKASAGQLYGYYIFNANAAARKVTFHNTAGTPTAGASVYFSLVIPAGSGANVEFANGIAFSTGIGITTVTGTADSDATAVAAGDLIINLFYK